MAQRGERYTPPWRKRTRQSPRPRESAKRFSFVGLFVGKAAQILNYSMKSRGDGGDEGIRTLETVSRLHP